MSQFFIDSAQREEIKRFLAMGLIDGVTTNPSSLAAQGNEPLKTITEIADLLEDKILNVQVTHEHPREVYKQAHAMAQYRENIVVKIPCIPHLYPVIDTLCQEGLVINVTLIFSLFQAIAMARLGASYISPFLGRLDDHNGNGIQLIHDIANTFHMYDYATEIVAASLRSQEHINESLRAGAHILTMGPELLEKAINHELSNNGVAQFLHDWGEHNTHFFT